MEFTAMNLFDCPCINVQAGCPAHYAQEIRNPVDERSQRSFPEKAVI